MLKSLFSLILIPTLVAVSAPAFAQSAFGHITTFSNVEDAALPGSLHDTMKAMSKALKSIDAANASSNVENAKAADLFVALTLHAKTFEPDGLDKMPAGAKAQYAKLLDATAATGRELAAAFRKGDNAKAQLLMNELNAEKKQGHGEYK